MYRIRMLLSLLLVVPAAASAAATTFVPWPADAKASATESCKQTIRDNVARDYLTMTSSAELPADFFQNAAPNLNPILDSCNCAVDKLARQISFDYYTAHVVDMTTKLQGLKAGACTPQPPHEAEDPDKPAEPEPADDSAQ